MEPMVVWDYLVLLGGILFGLMLAYLKNRG